MESMPKIALHRTMHRPIEIDAETETEGVYVKFH